MRVRVPIGIVITIALLLSIQETLDPPENLDTNQVAAPPEVHIEPSPPVEMYIPAVELVARFEEAPCRVNNGAIDPATMDLACAYTAEDRPYSLPGTATEDLTVIAGHTGAGLSGVFDKLYDGTADQHTIATGDQLYLRTEASGSQWLVYHATDLHDPDKEGLAQDPAVWGETAMPGRLLTISCIQPANPLAAAVRNAVVGWQYEGVIDEAPDHTVLPPLYPGLEPDAS
ncbi:hypothetical protein C3B44_01835 [Corynebacterium yudongzhengii]|uniref:Sortase n=1 Tax=Corynebacterium yudongzhengii TaxID=2080740 RepID=A0A2U1TA37_9CORY|nr:hypothetical protein [Corynebacterium yudongzhengii]AWB81236.1 hypothetical protein C3B44_01835 [Corynebacterium yudongzhengii]PWC02775.1 hypothetical protein DF222_00565 [Corynebacterium yudongzhengii]